MAVAPALYRNVGYDPIKSFAPVVMIARSHQILIVNPAVPAYRTGSRCWKNGSPRLKNESGWLQRKIESICAHQLMTPRYPK